MKSFLKILLNAIIMAKTGIALKYVRICRKTSKLFVPALSLNKIKSDKTVMEKKEKRARTKTRANKYPYEKENGFDFRYWQTFLQASCQENLMHEFFFSQLLKLATRPRHVHR